MTFPQENLNTSVGYLEWSPPNDCTMINGPIDGFKLEFKKINGNFTKTAVITKLYRYYLKSSIFQGNETYEIHLYALRSTNFKENKTAFTSKNITIPAQGMLQWTNEI